ncbi:MAG: exodeoxyribonuclease V subunit beta [Rubrivivax sp. SCN 71-131]|nr:MAG: exodeoxyribonuclease V subunit beta [Rubrivivax sp. SCN 71-131]
MTPQPLDVFEDPLDGTTLIEASAGTGKTWNLCGLVLRLLLEQGLELPHILVVTFTKAATAELRARIRARLTDTLAGLHGGAAGTDPFVAALLGALRRRGVDDETMRRRLQLALQTFDEASIFTIHGFCQRALAEAPFAAALPLSSELSPDDAELRRQVTNDFWRCHVVAPPAQALPAALAAHLVERKDTPERWAELLQRRVARPLSRAIWPETLPPPADEALLRECFTRLQAMWAQEGRAIVDLVAAALPRLPANVYKPATLALAAQGWERLLLAAGVDCANFALPKLDLLTSTRLQAKKGHAPIEAHPFFAAADALLALAAQRQHALEAQRLQLLRTLLEEGPPALRALKRQQRVMAFDDLLHDLHERLSSAAGARLAAALRARWPVALIDEFQDTDPLQWAIFDALHGAAGAPLFLLGDPKQAIYSFRHADLHTYLQARSRARTLRSLTENQRSTPALLAALNALFGRHARAFVLPGLDYLPLRAGAKPRPGFVDRSEARAPLQLWSLPRAPDGQPLPKGQARALAAQAVAAEIARLLAAARRGEVECAARPLAASDLAVLVRTHAEGALMRRALAAVGVGCVELSQADVHHSADAEELERVLAAMLAPRREGALRAALATGLMGLDAAAIEALAHDEAALLGHVMRFAAYREAWVRHGVGPMLRRWLQQEQVAPRLLQREDGERRLTNLLHLAERLHEAAVQHAAPESLLRWLQQQRRHGDNGDAAQLRLESDRDLVAIVTIHKSKGLEYPLVFCPFLWDGSLGRSDALCAGIDYHDEHGAAVSDFRPDAARAEVKAQLRLERLAEHVRLIYVALTRAVQRCVVVVGPYRSGNSTAQAGTAPLNGLLAGEGDALALPKKPLEPARIDAAWAAFAAAEAPQVGLQALPLPPAPALAPRLVAPQSLAALPAPVERAPSWTLGSFSSLARGWRHEAAARDHDDALPDAEEVAAAATGGAETARPRDEDDILAFPRGPEAGECLHALFERVDFGDASTWPAAAARALQLHPQPLVDAAQAQRQPRQLLRLLQDVLHAPLPLLAPQGSLAAVPATRRLVEWEFNLPLQRLTPAALAAVLARHGLALPLPAFAPLSGFLRGFVDLAFEHGGRWFVVDWKSNHLGDTPADYAGQALAEAVHAHGYGLQALLYALALHRHLQRRLRGYDAARDFGGAMLLFVRGLRPAWRGADGAPCGVFALQPSAALLDDLSALFNGEALP